MRTFVKMLLVALIFNFLPFAAFAQQSPPDLILASSTGRCNTIQCVDSTMLPQEKRSVWLDSVKT